MLEVEDVRDVGTAPGVDRLVLVAHHGEVAVLLGQESHELVLGAVRVLVLVDEEVGESPAPGLAYRGVALEQRDRPEEQVVEVEGPGRLEDLPVAGQHPAGDPRDRVLVLLAFPAGVLPGGDAREQATGRVQLLGEVQGAHGLPHRRELVGLVVDEEAGARGPAASASRRRRRTQKLWKVDIQLPEGPAGEQGLGPGAHLLGGLVREGDGENALRRHPAIEHEVGDAVGDDAGLAAAGAGEDEDRTLDRQNRFSLAGVQAPQDGRRLSQLRPGHGFR